MKIRIEGVGIEELKLSLIIRLALIEELTSPLFLVFCFKSQDRALILYSNENSNRRDPNRTKNFIEY